MMSWWVGWGSALLLLCWGVGARGRLQRLRADLEAAFASLDAQLVRQLAWCQASLPPAHGAAVEEPATSTAATLVAWQRLQRACERLAQTLASTRGSFIDPAALARLTQAHRALNEAWLQVRAGGRHLDGASLPHALDPQHEQLLVQLQLSREAFNEAAQAYNEAVGQFPAQLMAWGLRYRRAGVLPAMAEGA